MLQLRNLFIIFGDIYPMNFTKYSSEYNSIQPSLAIYVFVIIFLNTFRLSSCFLAFSWSVALYLQYV